jgi:hypothetical protein
MELHACPMCRSEFFVSSHSGKRVVFQMDAKRHPVHLWPQQQPTDTVAINLQALCCTTCFWRGSREALVVARPCFT